MSSVDSQDAGEDGFEAAIEARTIERNVDIVSKTAINRIRKRSCQAVKLSSCQAVKLSTEIFETKLRMPDDEKKCNFDRKNQ
jgi:hypothetical protein